MSAPDFKPELNSSSVSCIREYRYVLKQLYNFKAIYGKLEKYYHKKFSV